MRIGIPKALMFQYYYPFWRVLFEELGFEVVVSDKSTKPLVQKGIDVTVPEICFPVKIFSGHVINLIEKKVDYIFCPRFVHIEKRYWFCPKYIGLPELIEKTIPESKLLVAEIDCNREDTADYKCYKNIVDKFNVSKSDLKKALKVASEKFAEFRGYCYDGLTLDEATSVMFDGAEISDFDIPEFETTIGLLGYVYNVYDPFISMDIIGKLRDLKVNVVTYDMIGADDLLKYRADCTRPIFWTFPDKLYQSASVMIKDMNVQGLIHITAFGCGPDSIVGKEIEHDYSESGVPFMTLRIDEHTGESHLQTRIEAFTDMIKRKIRKVNEVKS